MWHMQTFSLMVVKDEGDVWHLAGKTEYGDNVLDEWFVVSLLKHVTEEVPSLVARITDNDGEILLIEAASVLPCWAGEPSVAEGRAFLHRGRLHLIPVCSSPATISPLPCITPSPATAASVVAGYPRLTLASDKVQEAIQARLTPLPHYTESNHHRVNVSLPRALAAMLGKYPGLLGRLVRAVMERDSIDTKACRQMTRVKQEGAVLCRLTFSKCLYAMLSGVQVKPYKGSGWTVGEDKAEQLGFKLATGLEILLSRSRGGEDDSYDVNEFNQFVVKLKDIGFFQGELEGSRKYKSLMEDCISFWQTSKSNLRDENRQEDIINMYKDALDSSEVVDNFFICPPGQEDDEQWLDITPESLDKMLEAQFGVPSSGSGHQIPEEINKFLQGMSDMTGVEHEDGQNLDPDNLMQDLKKLMAKMGEVQGEDVEYSDSEEDDYSGDEDPVMSDYMSRLDSEVLSSAAGRSDCPDLDSPSQVDASVLDNLLKSYSAQAELGGHGPASSLLQSLRLNPGRPK